MPTYTYSCSVLKCAYTKEVTHSMSECSNPLTATIAEITCPKHRILMKRVPQETQLMGFLNGTSASESDLLAAKQKERKHRSNLHFKNEVLEKSSKISEPEKKKFKARHKNISGDHEKLK